MNKLVLITGASSGIGKETAYVYAKNDYDLVLVARRLDNLNAIKNDIEEKYHKKVIIFDMDLSKLSSAGELYQKVIDNNLSIDVLINNAGFGIYSDFVSSEIEKEEQMLILNMVTLTKLCKLFLPDMIKKNTGNIVNIASTAAFQPVPSLATYAATKSYVLNFSEAIAYELKNTNVFITVINPGATQSEFGTSAGFKEDNQVFTKMPSSIDLAEFIYKSMIKKKTSAIHGLKNNLLVFSQRFGTRKLATKLAAIIMSK